MRFDSKDQKQDCVFCDVIDQKIPRQVRYEEENLIVFKNTLDWVPLMYIVAPKMHMSQTEFWCSPIFLQASRTAVRLGEEDAPNGFRLVSNFGIDAMQSQPHGHLHLLGGNHLGLYVDFPSKNEFWMNVYGQNPFEIEQFRGSND
ncbi:MAG: HIT domain-containing protein [SAR202 cluster bacterium]|nr:HIT domain-containing protein [SAR202 cluster bacterium]|tara:strand:+ start:63492 stop:63926 length:435 start_codon:yes stop_codon:yes gene_type:complete